MPRATGSLKSSAAISSYNPPWVNRPWVTTTQGRTAALGAALDCNQCDFPGSKEIRGMTAKG